MKAKSNTNTSPEKTPPSGERIAAVEGSSELAPGVEAQVGSVRKDLKDPESELFLEVLEEQERVRSNRIPSVSTVLIVLSAKGMVFDREALRQKVLLTYPDATVFFKTTLGSALGAQSPQNVDLVIDFTGPRQRQKFAHAARLRRMARFVVGRNAGFLRKRRYDRIFDEKALGARLPEHPLKRERIVQKGVLALAGVPLSQLGDTPPDRSFSIALELPPLKQMHGG